MSGTIPLSVAIITRNEEHNLPPCLQSVTFADEIIVVDSGSTDRTVKIAEEFGCRVFVEDWKGYGPQKNSAVSKCRNEWVLVLDADERVPEETLLSVRNALGRTRADAFSFRRRNYFHGKWIKYADNWPDRTVRLVNRSRGSFQSAIHERWITQGVVQHLDADIVHYGFSGYSDLLKTLNKYSTAAANELFSSGRRTNPLSPLSHGIGMFLRSFFLKRGFLGGIDGFIISLTKAGGSFFKYAKLLEMQRSRGAGEH